MPSAALPAPPPGPPSYPVPWTRRLWPAPPADPAAPTPAFFLVVGLGVLGGLLLRPGAVGTGVLLVGTAVLAAALRLGRRRPGPDQLAAAALAVVFLSVAGWRDAGWLVALCLLAAVALGGLAVSGGRTWTGLLVAVTAPLLRLPRTVAWGALPLLRLRLPVGAPGRVGAVAAVSGLLLFVFGGLFAAADAAFAETVGSLTDGLTLGWLGPHLPLLLLSTAAAGSAVHLATDPPASDALAPAAGRPVRRLEWVVPVVLLDLLFASFVLVQLTVLFGGDDHVLRTAGLTYAEYARKGFWQLLVVSLLTFVVLAFVVRLAAPADHRLVQLLLGVLCLLSLVVVASSLHRLGLYEQAYGWTRLRVVVRVAELTIGALFVLVLAAGAVWRADWLPRAAVAVVATGLLGLVALNPDAAIAEHDVHRADRDLTYLAGLSADAVPALLELPAEEQGCVLAALRQRLDEGDPWWDTNRSRVRARSLLGDAPACVSR